MISPPLGLDGAQRPRVEVWPADSRPGAGREAVELAASAGLVLDPWQQLVIERALARDADRDCWAAFEVLLLVPRQNGKGAILECRELAGLFLFGEKLILHSAHKFNTAYEAFLRMKALIEGTPDLMRKVLRFRQSHADVSVELRSGARLRYVARSKGSGRGFSADCIVLDEAFELEGEMLGAMMPTLAAKPDPQIWYASSAPRSNSATLHQLRRRALGERPAGLAAFEWSIDPDVDRPDDPEAWARANPALGRRLSLDHIRREQAALPPDEFAVERLGVPADPPEASRAGAFDEAAWVALADPAGEFAGPTVAVVDVSPSGRASVVVAGRARDGRVLVVLVANRHGVGWVPDVRARVDDRYGPLEWVRDPAGPAVELGGEWRDLAGRELVEACARFSRAVADGEISWRCAEADVPAVLGAVSAARPADRGDGGFVWSRRRSSGADISPLVAMTIAADAARRAADEVAPSLAVVL